MPDLVVALDYPAREPALGLVDRLAGRVGYYKVGLELFTRAGPDLVRELRDRGREVFLDLKLHDIPNTVYGAARAASDLGVDLVTVHAAGGSRMIEAASEAVEGSRTRIVAVTVLTSISEGDLAALGGRGGFSVAEEALRLADLSMEAGADGVVCSAGEAAVVRERVGEGATLVVPGVRLPGEEGHDQRRIFTPADAVRAGADLLVMGRSVTRAEDPGVAVDRIRAAMTMEPAEA